MLVFRRISATRYFSHVWNICRLVLVSRLCSCRRALAEMVHVQAVVSLPGVLGEAVVWSSSWFSPEVIRESLVSVGEPRCCDSGRDCELQVPRTSCDEDVFDSEAM